MCVWVFALLCLISTFVVKKIGFCFVFLFFGEIHRLEHDDDGCLMSGQRIYYALSIMEENFQLKKI